VNDGVVQKNNEQFGPFSEIKTIVFFLTAREKKTILRCERTNLNKTIVSLLKEFLKRF